MLWIENPFAHPKILGIRVMIFHCLGEDQEHPSCALNYFLQGLCFWFDNCNPSRTVLYCRQHAHKVEKPVHLLEYVLCTSILEHYTMYLAQRLRKALNLTNSIASKIYLAFIPLIISLFEFLDRVPHKLNQDILCKLFRVQIIILWLCWWRIRLLRRYWSSRRQLKTWAQRRKKSLQHFGDQKPSTGLLQIYNMITVIMLKIWVDVYISSTQPWPN